jgi:hypothetical protein
MLGRIRAIGRLAVTVSAVMMLSATLPLVASADPITVISNFNFLDVRSENTAGLTPGARVSFGVNATPNPRFNGDLGTTVIGTQGPLSLTLLYLDSPALPNQWFTSTACPPPCGTDSPPPVGLQGAWQLTITNPNSPNSPVIVNTPTLGAVTAPQFVINMSIGPGPAPTQPVFEWAYPAPGTFDTVSIQIFNLDDPVIPGVARLILERFGLPLAQQSFTVPAGVLTTGVNYSVSIQLDDLRLNGTLQARSRSFFNFSLDANGPPLAFLPTVGNDGVYRFNVRGILAGQTIFIDPAVAIGYDYATGPGNPNFASVRLPRVGDDLYDLYLWDGTTYQFHATVGADEDIDLAAIVPGGVDRFRILGIEASAGLDPANATAFVTGLTFVQDGDFTGTMTPIAANAAIADLKPGDGPNCVNPKSKGVVPLAILGTSVDVRTIVLSSLQIDKDSNPLTTGVAPKRTAFEDVDGDGVLDLVLHFDTSRLTASGLIATDQSLYITGLLSNGELFVGWDTVSLPGRGACAK